jgi:hypothetical protein
VAILLELRLVVQVLAGVELDQIANQRRELRDDLGEVDSRAWGNRFRDLEHVELVTG